MTGKATLESANVKYKSASDMSVSAANNYFWSLPVGDDGSVTYFTDNFTLAQAAGVILDEAPCYDLWPCEDVIIGEFRVSFNRLFYPLWLNANIPLCDRRAAVL